MEQEFCLIAEVIMTQYNMKQVLTIFNQSIFIVIEKEVHQLVTMDALDPNNLKGFSR